MYYYRYKLITPQGSVSSGITRLPYKDGVTAMTYLERDGGTAVYVKPLGALLSWSAGIISGGRGTRPSRTVQADFLNNLAVMLQSGISLTASLEQAAASLNATSSVTNIKHMVNEIQGGSSFSETADRNQNIFPKNIVYLIRIGEATGRLAEMLKKGAEHLQKIQAIINDTRQALMYPCFVLLAIMAGVVFWFYSVVPNIIQVFTEMDIALPPLTIAVMRVSAFVRSNILYLILLPSLLVAGTAILRRTSKRVLRLTDGLLLKLPVIGSIAVASNMAYITEYFSLLINSGITVLESLNILRDAVGNQFYSARLNHIGQRLIKGRKIAEAFDDAGIFPTYVTQMVSIGEASGSLPEQLKLISEEYSRKLNDTIALIGKMIEPIVLGLAGAMFAVIIGGLLLPIYDLLGGIAG